MSSKGEPTWEPTLTFQKMREKKPCWSGQSWVEEMGELRGLGEDPHQKERMLSSDTCGKLSLESPLLFSQVHKCKHVGLNIKYPYVYYLPLCEQHSNLKYMFDDSSYPSHSTNYLFIYSSLASHNQTTSIENWKGTIPLKIKRKCTKRPTHIGQGDHSSPSFRDHPTSA